MLVNCKLMLKISLQNPPNSLALLILSSPKAGTKTKTWAQVVYVGSDSRKPEREGETGKAAGPTTGTYASTLHAGEIPEAKAETHEHRRREGVCRRAPTTLQLEAEVS